MKTSGKHRKCVLGTDLKYSQWSGKGKTRRAEGRSNPGNGVMVGNISLCVYKWGSQLMGIFVMRSERK